MRVCVCKSVNLARLQTILSPSPAQTIDIWQQCCINSNKGDQNNFKSINYVSKGAYRELKRVTP